MRPHLLRRANTYICPQCQLSRKVASPRVSRRWLATAQDAPEDLQSSKSVRRRIEELGGPEKLKHFYPRWKRGRDSPNVVTTREYLSEHFEDQRHGQTEFKRKSLDKTPKTVYGRVRSRRNQGGQLTFIDLENGGTTLQAVLKSTAISADKTDGRPLWDLKEERRKIRRGDWLALTGHSYTTETGERSILVTEKPQTLAPSLQHVPESITDTEFLNHHRHVDRIVHPSARESLVFRHRLIHALRSFFLEHNFIELSTPQLVAQAGGAIARPFETTATEFSETALQLRIAPELFLKRLIVGGMDKVFEIGPSFRNEGIDAVHNPEFYICEFYQVMTKLRDLIKMTESLFDTLQQTTSADRETLQTIPDPTDLQLKAPFKRIDFIPALEDAIRERIPEFLFPDLRDEAEAREKLMAALITFDSAQHDAAHVLPLPSILDKLCSLILEPQSAGGPLWIKHHPECMSPLAKTCFSDDVSYSGKNQRVSARAELFIHGREYVNCYEEENSPVEQRRKFNEQRRYQLQEKGKTVEEADEHELAIDENYVEALEWGMPPTGGWGCGIDRLVMLFSGRKRIADVLPFGNLANVVGLGSRGPGPGRKNALKRS